MAKFNLCLDSNNLLKISQKEPKFTWSNNRKGASLVLEKLDMAFGYSQWMDKFPLSHINNLIISASDHSPIILNTTFQTPSKRQQKFEPHWYNIPGCQTLIETAWQSTFRGSASFVLYSKLQSTLAALSRWRKSRVGNFKQKIA